MNTPNEVSQSEYDTVLARQEAAQKRADTATAIACELEKILTPEQVKGLSGNAQTWIKLRRAELQKVKIAALKKLTPEERSALGLPNPA